MRISTSTLLLAVVCVALAVALAVRWTSHNPAWSPPAPQAMPDTLFLTTAPPISSAAAARPADVLAGRAEIANRPLFSPDRRPAAQPSASTPAATLDDIALIGVFSTDSAGGAILMIDGIAQRLRIGERIGALTLRAVNATQAHFVAADGRDFTLELQRRQLPPVADQAARADRAQAANEDTADTQDEDDDDD